MFGTNLKDHHKTFKNQKYEWLNKVIHKDLGEPLSREHLDKLQVRYFFVVFVTHICILLSTKNARL